MNIDFLPLEGCSNTPKKIRSLGIAAASAGPAESVNTLEMNAFVRELIVRAGFGSPAPLVDGRDLFGSPLPVGSAPPYRLYGEAPPGPSEIAARIRLANQERS